MRTEGDWTREMHGDDKPVGREGALLVVVEVEGAERNEHDVIPRCPLGRLDYLQ